MIEKADSYDIISNEEAKSKESEEREKELDYDLLEVTSVDNELSDAGESKYNELSNQNQELIDNNNVLISEKKETEQKLTDIEGNFIVL